MAAALAFLSQERAEPGPRALGGLRGQLQSLWSFVFCCEFLGSTRSFTFNVEEEDGAEAVLAWTRLCLREPGPPGDCRPCGQPQVVLHGCSPRSAWMTSSSNHLKSGSGPARITGRHQMVTVSNDISEEEERGEEGCEEEEAELCPILPAKKQRGRP